MGSFLKKWGWTGVFYALTLSGEAVTFSEKGKEERNDFTIYPKNAGHCTPVCSAMDFTMKLGPLPI